MLADTILGESGAVLAARYAGAPIDSARAPTARLAAASDLSMRSERLSPGLLVDIDVRHASGASEHDGALVLVIEQGFGWIKRTPKE
jgi:hypothetical protein